jgi:co-chaperonin GroES (HSP10)
LIVEPIKENIKQSSGGLLLAEKHREDLRYKKAIVKNVGHEIPPGIINEGDSIYFDRAAGFNMEIEEVIHTVIRLDDVVAVV